jgi:hypothetical protein
MPGNRYERTRRRAEAKIARLKEQILTLDLLSAGTLLRRMKVCGKPTCRCAEDPDQRHGPYFEWTFRHNGRLVHRVISADQADLLRAAIKNNRTVLKLIRAWQHETRRVIEAVKSRNYS